MSAEVEQDVLAGRINAAMEEWDAIPAGQGHSHMASHVAASLSAAGYSRPRIITTIEELQALPHGSVIRSEHRHYWVAHKEDGEGGNQGWAAAGTGTIPDLTTWFPATVLHEPTEEKQHDV